MDITVFPGLDALLVLDASGRFDAGLSGRNTFQTTSNFNVQFDACAPFDAGHTTHDLLIEAHACASLSSQQLRYFVNHKKIKESVWMSYVHLMFCA